jgi:hypothetical protein
MAQEPRDLSLEVKLKGLDEKIAELREVIREANGMLKDLDREKRNAANLITSRLSADALEKAIGELIDEGLKKYDDSLAKAIDMSEKRIWNRFDLIVAIALGEDAQSVRQGKPSIDDLIRQHIAFHGPLPVRPPLPDKFDERVAHRLLDQFGLEIRSDGKVPEGTMLVIGTGRNPATGIEEEVVNVVKQTDRK